MNSPDAVYVFDHFHVVKLMNEHRDNIRVCSLTYEYA